MSLIRFNLTGIVGDRLQAVRSNWLLEAPHANPAMLEIFDDRDVMPYRDLLPWSGEFAGKYLTSAVQVYCLTRDQRMRRELESFVSRLIQRQDADGYLGPWPADSRLTNYSPVHGPPGEGLLTWDTWGHYHITLGLLLWQEAAAVPQALRSAALATACRMADLLCSRYLDAPPGKLLVDSGYSEMNLAPVHSLALLYRKTRKPEYLKMALQIVEEFSAQKDGVPIAGDYLRQPLAGKEFYETPKPRWESLHPVMGLAELYRLTHNQDFRTAFERIWWSIRDHDRHNNGGFSSGEQATGNPFDPRPIETCCTIAWMAMSVEMLKLQTAAFAASPSPIPPGAALSRASVCVADELELSTLNSVLGMHHVSGRWATYNTPSDGTRFASAHQIVFQARPGSPELNCCSVNSPRGLGMIGDWAVLRNSAGVFLNYYGPGSIRLPARRGLRLELVQETRYPLEPRLRLLVNPSSPAEFTLHLRIPGWSVHTHLSLNGEALPEPTPGEYLALKRLWQPGDCLEIEFDFNPRFWKGERECEGMTSIYRGPLLLALDQRYNRHLYRTNASTQLPMDAGKVYPPWAADIWKLHTFSLPVPAIKFERLHFSPAAWDDWLPPGLLLSVPLRDGRRAFLCDYASAGQTGSLYRSWL